MPCCCVQVLLCVFWFAFVICSKDCSHVVLVRCAYVCVCVRAMVVRFCLLLMRGFVCACVLRFVRKICTWLLCARITGCVACVSSSCLQML